MAREIGCRAGLPRSIDSLAGIAGGPDCGFAEGDERCGKFAYEQKQAREAEDVCRFPGKVRRHGDEPRRCRSSPRTGGNPEASGRVIHLKTVGSPLKWL